MAVLASYEYEQYQEALSEYGDQILLGLVDARDESLTMEEQAKKFVSEYWSPEKPSMIGVYGTDMVMNEEYAKALYKASRTK